MDRRGQHDKEMEYLMRASPYIESAGKDRFREARAVEKGANDQQKAFEEIERHPA